MLAAIDAGPCARMVVETALSVADFFEGSVVALHVREKGSDIALEAAHAAGVELLETDGSPIEGIITAAEDPRVVAVVLGARAVHGGPRPAGHVALEVITRVNKPVVVVPPDWTTRARIARVLIPLEGTDESSQAIADTIALARRRDIEFVVLHVHAPETVPAFEDQPHHEVPAWEGEFVARFVSVPHADVEVIQRVGVAADRIVAVAGDVEADLIALGWNQNLAPGRARVVREALIHSIPVLLVPTRLAGG
ncbi:MAG: universal stress protein [Solirubrobacteraceae bacterium]